MSSQGASQGAHLTRLTGDGAGYTSKCRLCGVLVYTDTAVATTGIIYDNASAASGTILANVAAPATAKGSVLYWFGDEGINCTNGIYVDGTFGAAAHAITVYYKPV